MKLDYEIANKLLRADFEAGKLFWRERTPSAFATTGTGGAIGACNRWNARHAGKEAGGDDGQGYRKILVNGRICRVHRVMLLLATGQWPDEFVDHINGDQSDNRLSNLREVTNSVNLRNQSVRSNNKSGVMGVRFCIDKKRWRAEIGVDGKRKSLGYFTSFEEAVTARKSAEQKLGFHPNHGRAA